MSREKKKHPEDQKQVNKHSKPHKITELINHFFPLIFTLNQKSDDHYKEKKTNR